MESSVYGLAVELAKKFSVTVIDMPRGGVKNGVEVIDGVTVYRFRSRGKWNVSALKSVDDYVRIAVELQPDVCHLHGTGMFNEILYRKFAKLGLPTMITVRGILAVEQKNALAKKFTMKRVAQLLYQRYYVPVAVIRCRA